MANPFFSILIPVYSAARTLPDLLRAILAQSDPDFEVIFSDDGSRDDSLQIIESVCDPRFRILRAAHTGYASAARNRALASAQGRFILMIDADDLIAPDAIREIKKRITASGTPDVLTLRFATGAPDASGEWKYSSTSAVLPARTDIVSGKMILEKLACARKNLVCNGFIAAYRREFLLEHNLFQTETLGLAEDHEWLPRVFFYAERVAVSEYLWYLYIRREKSLSLGLNMKAMTSAAEAARRLCGFYALHRREMTVKCRVFWCDHALSPFLWYYFHPLYRNVLSGREWKEALKKSNLFGSFIDRKNVFRVLIDGSPSKKLYLLLLVPLFLGFPSISRFLMRFLFSKIKQ